MICISGSCGRAMQADRGTDEIVRRSRPWSSATRPTSAPTTTTFTPRSIARSRSRAREREASGVARAGGRPPRSHARAYLHAHRRLPIGGHEQRARRGGRSPVHRDAGANGVYPAMYYNHNLDFLASAAMMSGQFAEAKRAAGLVVTNTSPDDCGDGDARSRSREDPLRAPPVRRVGTRS